MDFFREGIKIGKLFISWTLLVGLLFIFVALDYLLSQNKLNQYSSNKSANKPETEESNESNNADLADEEKSSSSSSKSTKSSSSNNGTTDPTNPAPTTDSDPVLTTYNLVALGDSLTNAASPNPSMIGNNPSYSFSTGTNISSFYLYLNSIISNVNPINLAVSGAKSSGCLNTQVPQVDSNNPDYITLLIGGNDIQNFIAPSTFSSNLYAIASTIDRDDRRVFIATIPNYVVMKSAQNAACLANPLTPEEEIALGWILGQYNSIISTVASTYGFTLVDLYPYLDQDDISDYDCIHLSLTGLQTVANRFKTSY